MSRKYKQLSLAQRHQIEFLLKQGKTIRAIAQEIGVNPSTISREIKRNSSPIHGKYTAEQAQKRRDNRRKNSNKKYMIENNPSVEKYVREKLKEGYSPEMIEKRGRMEKVEHTDRSVSKAGLLKDVPFIPCKETIYCYAYRSYKEKNDMEIINCLRTKKKRRRKRILKKWNILTAASVKQRGIIRDKVFIDQRPREVNERKRIGDWEIDTIEGKGHKGIIVSMVERVSRTLLLRYVSSKSAKDVCQTIMNALAPFHQLGLVKSITFDNGKEFAFHHTIAKKWNIPTFFTHPYSAWEKGSVERFNKDVRYYIPKKTPFSDVCIRQIPSIQDRINNLPRKVLGYLSPYEFFFYALSNQNYSLNLNHSLKNNLLHFQLESAR